ncbi:MAG: efflux RND transporter periplasmic adaptor subunit [Tannerella sp.]|jgi:HlyD family secretion protein|nr:efflux RND transporter periplasmic adaptor subunit [Tannerella sp.]
MSEEKYSTHNMMLAFITVLVVIGIVALAGFFMLRPDEEIIIGQAEAAEVRISSMVPGRIDTYYFKEGDRVQKGDTLVHLRIPVVMARLQQAEAAREAAQAQDDKALKGARAEQITGARELWQKAVAGLEIAERSYKRVRNLYDNGVVSAQKRDEAEANYKAMVASEKAAKAQYDMLRNGAEREDKQAAQALVAQAKGAVAEVQSYIDESVLISPVNGQVSERFPETGELVGTGAPIMNIVDLSDAWVTFSVRENLLDPFKTDHEFQAFIPALNNREVTLRVYYLKDMGTYAAWKATKTRGQYDVKTFEVRARPVTPIADLRPGMSVILKK